MLRAFLSGVTTMPRKSSKPRPKRKLAKPQRSRPKSSSAKQNEALLHHWFEQVWNNGRRETIHQLMVPSAVLLSGTQTITGPDEFAKFFDDLRSQLDRIHIDIIQSLAADDLVAVHWKLTARHIPTEKNVTFTGSTIAQVKNGLFVAAWQNYDEAALASQIATAQHA
jgi:predicted SnoaL-like aldol condensation-catalyzing enzyme